MFLACDRAVVINGAGCLAICCAAFGLFGAGEYATVAGINGKSTECAVINFGGEANSEFAIAHSNIIYALVVSGIASHQAVQIEIGQNLLAFNAKIK